MTSRVQTLRSSVPIVRPTGRQPGELYVNYPDNQLGVINVSGTPVDLIPVRFFSPLTSYSAGDFVCFNGNLYQAVAPSTPGVFVATNWAQIAPGGGGGGAGIPDAPLDGQQYGRQSGSWTVVNTNYLPLTGGTLTGPLTLTNDPTSNLQAATKQYVDAHSGTGGGAGFLPLSGGALTGPLTLAADPTTPLGAATMEYVDNEIASAVVGAGGIPEAPTDGQQYGRQSSSWTVVSQNFLPLSGGTVSGPITLPGAPTTPLEAVNKSYVDNAIASIPGGADVVPPLAAANWATVNFSYSAGPDVSLVDVPNGVAFQAVSNAQTYQSQYCSAISVGSQPIPPYTLDIAISSLGLFLDPTAGYTGNLSFGVGMAQDLNVNTGFLMMQIGGYDAQSRWTPNLVDVVTASYLNYDGSSSLPTGRGYVISSLGNKVWVRIIQTMTTTSFQISTDGLSYLPMFTTALFYTIPIVVLFTGGIGGQLPNFGNQAQIVIDSWNLY
jgi:hypothetical protein